MFRRCITNSACGAAPRKSKKLWARRLREEAQTSVLFRSGATDDGPNHDDKVKKDLSLAQLERYDFFSNERGFVKRLTDIAEELRDKDRGERKQLAPQKMASLINPETVYLP
jgi:Rps23 Pro-64 3,4-dihydroxylase Tpa1-like proline 4-hydroxylase